MLKNDTKMAPKRVPKWAPEGRPRLPKDHMGALRGPGRSCGLPRSPAQSLCLLLVLALLLFVFLILFVCACCCFFRSFVRAVCLYVCLFLVVCFVSCCCVFVLCLRLRDVRRVPCSFWGHLKETCNMFQDVSEWFTGDADSFGMRWVCASRDGSLIGGLES